MNVPNQVEPTLIQPLFDSLQQQHFVTLSTIDFETSAPNVSAISWVTATDHTHIRFAVDNRSRIVKNLQKQPDAVINIIANESCYSISGHAVLLQERLANVPLKLALIELTVKEVRDVMFYGSKISTEPNYEKTYDPVAAAKLDKQVIQAVQNA